jgi:NADH-quinone oxidoreductase subunit C
MPIITLDGATVAQRIAALVPDSVEEVRGELAYVASERISDVCRALRDDPDLDMQMLRGLDVADFIDRFELRYSLLSLRKGHQAVLKVRLWGRDDLTAPSVTPVWEGANLQEREVYDLMGISFEGHPNMKRVLLWEGFPGHPLRKDFQ